MFGEGGGGGGGVHVSGGRGLHGVSEGGGVAMLGKKHLLPC